MLQHTTKRKLTNLFHVSVVIVLLSVFAYTETERKNEKSRSSGRNNSVSFIPASGEMNRNTDSLIITTRAANSSSFHHFPINYYNALYHK